MYAISHSSCARVSEHMVYNKSTIISYSHKSKGNYLDLSAYMKRSNDDNRKNARAKKMRLGDLQSDIDIWSLQ